MIGYNLKTPRFATITCSNWLEDPGIWLPGCSPWRRWLLWSRHVFFNFQGHKLSLVNLGLQNQDLLPKPFPDQYEFVPWWVVSQQLQVEGTTLSVFKLSLGHLLTGNKSSHHQFNKSSNNENEYVREECKWPPRMVIPANKKGAF